MPRPTRDQQFDPSEVCIVHAVQRCVRRALLAGVDPLSGKDYSFRKEWIRRRLEALASVFAVDVLSYAIMSNHIHVILRNRPDVVSQWSDQEVALRWLKVFPGRRIEEHLAEPTENDVKTLVGNKEKLAEVRRRLADISWLMRSLSEPIARMANKQDECTGRFWEGRFKAQRIVDEAGLLACAMYVDLNPVRAALAESPEQSLHTSAYDRIEGGKGKEIASAAFELVAVPSEEAGGELRRRPVEVLRQERRRTRVHATGKRVRRDGWLSPLTQQRETLSQDAQVHREGLRASDRGFLSLSMRDYLRLLRWTAGQGVAGLERQVPESLSTLLGELGIDAGKWRDLVWNWQRYFGRSSCAGHPESMKREAERRGRHWHRGQRSAAACFVA
jgi:REP element-mobilizing transposase RayT